jgi:lipopolysaccharide/colanic/teichoic acid biosynthesis glycosyltransferase
MQESVSAALRMVGVLSIREYVNLVFTKGAGKDISTGRNSMAKKEMRGLWKPLFGNDGKQKNKHSLGIYSEDQFEEIIQYERTRSDREGCEISIVFYSLNGHLSKKQELKKLITVIKENVRLTDHLGWYPKNKIGIVLPYTSYEGAERFNTKIQDTNPFGFLPCEIQTYPNDWLANRGGSNSDKQQSKKRTRDKGKGKVFFAELPWWKRLMDIAGSLFGLFFFSPLFLLYTVYIKIVSPGPAFFKQLRVGQGRKEFQFIKFRTMKPNDQVMHSHHARDFINANKPMEKLDVYDPRIIPGGRFFRKTCLDEVPQFINILRGEMSMVGPRPCIPYEADEYERWHSHRFCLVPGLTGLWQVSGKNELTFPEMIRLDITYEQKMSPWLDVKILIKTLPTVIQLTFEATMNKIRYRNVNKGTPMYESPEYDKKVSSS